MKIRDIYNQRRPAWSFEFFPPKTEKGREGLLQTADDLKALDPAFFSMTYGAGGSTRDKTVSLGRELRERTGIETVCHVTCVDQSKDEVRAVLQELRAAGMENVMALRGDPPRGVEKWEPHPEGFHYAHELVSEAVGMGGFSIAVAGFPEIHPDSPDRESDLKHLKDKVDKGADVVVTQLFFDNEDFFRFDRDLKAMGVTIPIVPGIMPILSTDQVRRFTAMCKARIPDDLNNRLELVRGDDEAAIELGIEVATAQIRGLLEYGVPGVHIYCLNKSRSSEGIVARLKT